jgi:hypothetical protein
VVVVRSSGGAQPQIEAEAWAELRRRCIHLDRAKLTPVRRFVLFGGVTLKVISADTMLPVAVCSITRCSCSLGRRRANRGRLVRRFVEDCWYHPPAALNHPGDPQKPGGSVSATQPLGRGLRSAASSCRRT